MENKKILIVDDQYGIRMLLLEVFAKEGYETFQAANGKEALKIVENGKPDMVLLDMKIPGMDGLEILKRIRKLDKQMKVIMMTAYGELDMLKEANNYGVITHFTKPFDIEQLRLTVKDILSENQTVVK